MFIHNSYRVASTSIKAVRVYLSSISATVLPISEGEFNLAMKVRVVCQCVIVEEIRERASECALQRERNKEKIDRAKCYICIFS
jgi:hypothetical protein